MPLHKFELWPSLPFCTKKTQPQTCQAHPKYWWSALLKGTESAGGKKKIFFLFSTYFCLCGKHIHTESFIEDKLCATCSVQQRETVNTCSISCLYQHNEQCYGAMHRYNEMPPEHITLGPCKGTVVANDAFQFVN